MRTGLILSAFAALATLATAHKAIIESKNETAIKYKHFDCGTSIRHASAHFNATVHGLHKSAGRYAVAHSPAHKPAVSRQSQPIDVNAVFHIITTEASAGSITQAMADAQIATLNTAYNPYNIFFNLINTTFTANDAWAVAAGSDMDALKAALRQGTYATLNLYFHTDLTGDILGTCTLPSAVPSGADASMYVSDGCNVNANTMPGGLIVGYNSGMTAVHETGHWMGLLHTFEGYSCSGNGDFIDDTPFESVSTDGCPAKPAKDSCPGSVGVDPIHNYMDYSDDGCYTGFTAGQQARMGALWGQYRQGN